MLPVTFIIIFASTIASIYSHPFVNGVFLIASFVEMLEDTSGPLTYKFHSYSNNGFTMIAQRKRSIECLWLCKHSGSNQEYTCHYSTSNYLSKEAIWNCTRKEIDEIEKWTKIVFSAKNGCQLITSHLYATYRYSNKLRYKNFAGDIKYFLKQHEDFHHCQVNISHAIEAEHVVTRIVTGEHRDMFGRHLIFGNQLLGKTILRLQFF
jgi:hypothetical protein